MSEPYSIITLEQGEAELATLVGFNYPPILTNIMAYSLRILKIEFMHIHLHSRYQC